MKIRKQQNDHKKKQGPSPNILVMKNNFVIHTKNLVGHKQKLRQPHRDILKRRVD